MSEGKRRSPHELRFAESYALASEHRGHLEESLSRWLQVRKQFPGSWKAYVNPAHFLRHHGRFGEAESLLKEATKRFPDVVQGWIEFARVAENVEDWNVAKTRWTEVTGRFRHVLGVLGQQRTMIMLSQLDEAESFLTEMRVSFEYEPEVAAAWARVAELRGDQEVAIGRWAAARRRFPLYISAYQEEARLLRAAGRDTDYEMLMSDAKSRFPSEAWCSIGGASGICH